MKLAHAIRTFDPETWGEIDKFRTFYETTYQFKPDSKKAVSGVAAHFKKALTLKSLARKLAPNLAIDMQEMDEKGYTGAINAVEFTAVVEGIFLELYSSVECARKIITAALPNVRGMKQNSTRVFFTWGASDKVRDDFPAQIREAVVQATWYPELRALRDELTHSSIGMCHLDTRTSKISYMHTGVVRNQAALHFEDLFAKIDDLLVGVDRFMGVVFQFLNSNLYGKVADHVGCGFFFGRVYYTRKLTFTELIDFNSGLCNFWRAFDETPEFRCPLANNCGAYTRAREMALNDAAPLSPPVSTSAT
jgi:hypothetical protein